MDDQTRDYAVGYGKPPVESRFQKGQSGNPGGRPHSTKKLLALLGDALSHRSGMLNPDGSHKTYAEAIFAGLVGLASGPDLKAKKLLFDVLVKLQQANICHPSDRLPEVQLDEGETGAPNDVSAATDRFAAAAMPSVDPPLQDAKPADSALEVMGSPHPPG